MKICIDAGHNYSGWDTGAVGNGLREQDITWLIADKLRQLLEAAGVDVVMTRTAKEQNLGCDLSSSLRRRVEVCNKLVCDYFVSIHCNAGGGTGTETLVIAKGGTAEKLAECVQHYVVKVTGKSRGVKESNAYVLKHTNCPAILVETAFIDTEADSLLLRYRHDEFSEAIFKGICEHCGITTEKLSDEETIKDNIGLADETIEYLKAYKYGADLIRKIADAVRK